MQSGLAIAPYQLTIYSWQLAATQFCFKHGYCHRHDVCYEVTLIWIFARNDLALAQNIVTLQSLAPSSAVTDLLFVVVKVWKYSQVFAEKSSFNKKIFLRDFFSGWSDFANCVLLIESRSAAYYINICNLVPDITSSAGARCWQLTRKDTQPTGPYNGYGHAILWWPMGHTHTVWQNTFEYTLYSI